MNNHDSDDSSDDGTDCDQTKVLLGYASKDITEDTFSQLGGHPSWLDQITAPSADLARCSTCHGLLSLLLQLNGDLPNHFPTHERRLYILACRKKTCRRKIGSVRAIRAVRASDVPEVTRAEKQAIPDTSNQPKDPKPAIDLGTSIFGGKPLVTKKEPIATTPEAGRETDVKGLTDTFASKASITSQSASATIEHGPARPSEPWPPLSDFPQPYPSYYLDAEYESLYTDPSANEIPKQAQVDMDIDHPDSTGTDVDIQTAFETNMDQTFQKFADRMAQNPDQVLRYEFGGVPLLYSKTDAVGVVLHEHTPSASGMTRGFKRVPRCGNCGSERVYEMQLTPNAIMELEAQDESLDGMDWGTIVLMVCANDCVPRHMQHETGKVGYLEEWIGVQWEEVVKR